MNTLPKDTEESAVWFGQATISPGEPIIAGQMGTWTITYTVGRYGIDNGGRIKVAMPLASDWAIPQMDDPEAPDYLTVSTDGEATLRAVYQPKGHFRPWFKVTTIYVLDNSLKEGDRVFITYGDRSQDGPGTRAQTFRQTAFEFRVLVESFETNVFVRVPSSPKLPIVGSEASRLVFMAPSHVTYGRPFSMLLKAEDGWGNPAPKYEGTVRLRCDEPMQNLPEIVHFRESDGGVMKIEGLVAEPGEMRVAAIDEADGMKTWSNPILCSAQDREYSLFWTDLHGQTDSTVGTGSVEEYFAFARDVGFVDACTHQGNDFQITTEDWEEIVQGTREFHTPGEFVTFLGYEWSGTTPGGGDHNVIYFSDDEPIRRSSHWQIPNTSDEDMDCYPITKLYESLRDRDALIIPHIGGRKANPDFHDPDLEPVIEICSVHGRFEWFLQEALERGYRVGVIGAGDDHTGRPGASYGTSASFGVRSGLAGVLAKSLTREGIWEALRARRTYATTGERIVLSVTSEGHHMGEEFVTSKDPEIMVGVRGTGPLQSVQVVRGSEVVYSHLLVEPEAHSENRIRIAWSGARLKSRGRHTDWTGRLTVEGGAFEAVREFAFDNPRHGVTNQTETKIEWSSITCGDLDGLIVDIAGEGNPKVFFESEPISFSFTLTELKKGSLTHDAGGVEQKVEVSLARTKPGPESANFTFRDKSADRGLNPYYVRVTQEDGEMAWSSPLYVERKN